MDTVSYTGLMSQWRQHDIRECSKNLNGVRVDLYLMAWHCQRCS